MTDKTRAVAASGSEMLNPSRSHTRSSKSNVAIANWPSSPLSCAASIARCESRNMSPCVNRRERTGCQQAKALGGDGLTCGSPKRFLSQLLGAPRFTTLVQRLRQEDTALRVASVSRFQKGPGFVESTEADQFSWGHGRALGGNRVGDFASPDGAVGECDTGRDTESLTTRRPNGEGGFGSLVRACAASQIVTAIWRYDYTHRTWMSMVPAVAKGCSGIGILRSLLILLIHGITVCSCRSDPSR